MTTLEKFMFDIVVRVPSCSVIIRDGYEYWMLDDNKFTHHIPKTYIEELVEEGYLTKNKNGSVVPSSFGVDFAHKIVMVEKTIENPWRPGNKIHCVETPEKWCGV